MAYLQDYLQVSSRRSSLAPPPPPTCQGHVATWEADARGPEGKAHRASASGRGRRHTEAAVAKHESKDADASWMLAVPAAADASALQGDLLRLLAVFMKIPQVYFLKCCKQHKRICICV